MMTVFDKLPPRLSRIAALVPAGAKLADVGTDHALLPIFLLEQGIAVSAVATDINPAPLSRAMRNAAACEREDIRFVCCDGLEGVGREEADTVVIAGLGGETIAGILSRTPWLREGVTLLLQPMTKAECLRRWLCENGFSVCLELLAEDSGRVYPILCARSGESTAYTPGEYYAGSARFLRGDPLYARILEEQLRRVGASVRGLSAAANVEEERLAEQRELLNDFERLRRECQCQA